MLSLGERIKESRMNLRWSQGELAKRISVSQSAVAHWERNKNQPSLEQLAILATALEAPQDWLAFGVDMSGKVEVIAEMIEGQVIALAHGHVRYVGSPPADDGSALCAVEVMDDTLYPQYKRGDVLFVSQKAMPATDAAKANVECFVELEDGQLVVRRLNPTNDPARWNLISFHGTPMNNVTIRYAKPILWVKRSMEPTNEVM